MPHTYAPRLFAACFLVTIGTASCGGDDDGSGDAGGGGLDGSIDGAGRDAGPGSDSGGADGGGAACDELPALPEAALTDCSGTSFTACGGAIPDGTWEIDTVCETMPAPWSNFPSMVCASVDRSTVEVVRTITGSFTFGGGELERAIDSVLEVRFEAPGTCGHACNCETWARSRSVPTTCDPTCNAAGACVCTLDLSGVAEQHMTYTLTGNTIEGDIVGSSPSIDFRSEYCVAGDELRVLDGSYDVFLPSHLTLTRRAALDFEACNGFDDDDDGTVDEAPTDCDACLAEGVCSQGSSASCAGGAWSCTYVAADHEDDETTCDTRDNDCDGTVDEADDCCVADTECDDGMDCTTDTCVASTCRHVLPGDADGDGFAGGSGPCGGDCADDEPDAFPGQTSNFTEPYTDASGNPSFDYNCDGIEQPRDMRTASSCTTQEPPPSCPTCERMCAGSGWVGGPPACGVEGDLRICNALPTGACDGTFDTAPRTQGCR